MTFDEFFEKATGYPPYGYQRRLAANGLPAALQAPTGTGKTAATVLAWLWRRLYGPEPQLTPRRLVFALPQRTLVEQAAREVQSWLSRLGLDQVIALHVVMGGEGRSQGEWRMRMDQPAIVVGTVDSLVSKILNRGYGISRAIYPIDFALVTNGAQWVLDEVQLCPESTKTLRQVAAWADPARDGSWPTAEPFRLTCMSATIPPTILTTVDNPPPTDVVRIEQADRVDELAVRLGAARTIRQLPVTTADASTFASKVQELHRPGSLTLVVVNQVRTAQQLYGRLHKGSVPCTLLHSRFRAADREALVGRVLAPPGAEGHIVVSTQVVEAGIDLNAAVLLTEAAPWPSLVQRAGRCNRTGRVADAELWWCRPAKADPYESAEIDATAAELTALEGQALTGEELLARDVATVEQPVSVVRRPDLLALFDTTPDLSGADIDIAPYVRDTDDLDVQLAWARWVQAETSNPPPAGSRQPPASQRCRVPLSEVRKLLGEKWIWRFDHGTDQWTRVTRSEPPRPGEVLVMAARDGCYDPATGFDPSVKAEVPDSPELVPRPDRVAGTDSTSGTEEAYGQDSLSAWQRDWVTLAQHSEDARREARELLRRIAPSLPQGVADAVTLAAYLHDAGKAHPVWQDALCALASDAERERVAGGRPWAKSSSDGRLAFAGGVAFRHELASVLLLDGPLRTIVADAPEPDLVRYLVLAHHGKLRVQVRGPDDIDDQVLLGIRDGERVEVPPLLGAPAGQLVADIRQFDLGDERSWTRRALRLRDRYGPFLLAYLETLVRMADWRASENPYGTTTTVGEQR